MDRIPPPVYLVTPDANAQIRPREGAEMIVVTAPTGTIGRQVVERLLEGSAPIRVIARDPSRLAPHVRERVEVVQGSHGDWAVATRAFTGADSVFWLAPPGITAVSLEAAY